MNAAPARRNVAGLRQLPQQVAAAVTMIMTMMSSEKFRMQLSAAYPDYTSSLEGRTQVASVAAAAVPGSLIAIILKASSRSRN